MHLKRLFTVLITLSVVLAINVSCDNDRDLENTESKLELTDLANTYASHTLIINAHEAEAEQKVEVTANNDGTATFVLKNLIENNPVITFTTPLKEKENGAYSFEYDTNIFLENKGWYIQFQGSFVGSSSKGTMLIVNFKDVKHLEPSDIAKTFKLKNLTVNGKSSTSNSVYLKIDRLEGYNATVSFAYIAPHYSFLLANSGIYNHNITLEKGEEINTFVFSTVVNPDIHRTVTISGLYKDGIFHLTTEVEMHTDFLGSWSMSTIKNPWTITDIRINLNTGNAGASEGMSDAEIAASLEVIGGSAIQMYIDALKINLLADGFAKISYALKNKEGESKLEELPIPLNYVIETDNKGANHLHLFIETEMLAALEAMLVDTPIKFSDIKKIFTVQGSWSVIKITLEKDTTGDTTVFKFNNKILVALATIAVDALPATQEEMDEVMPGIPLETLKTMFTIVKEAKTGSTLGIGFKKEAV